MTDETTEPLSGPGTWTDEQLAQRDAIWNAAQEGEDDPLILLIDGKALDPLTARLLEEKKILLRWVDDLENQVDDLEKQTTVRGEEIERLNEALAGLPEMREEIDALRGRNTGFAGGTKGADEVPGLTPGEDFETTLHGLGVEDIGVVIKVEPDRDHWIEKGTWADIEMGIHRLEPEATLELLMKVTQGLLADLLQARDEATS